MRILHVITSLRTGGAEHLMVDLLPKLRDLGNDVELLLFDGTRTAFYKELEQEGIKIHSFGIGGNVYQPRNIFKLRKFIGKYDIVHTHNTACQLFAPIAKLLKCSKVKLVTTEHSTNNRRRGKWYLKSADKWMYARYAKVICISEQLQRNLEEHIGKHDKIMTIFNGVDTAKFLSPIKDISGNGSFIITMVASLSAAKDQDTLIRAMAELPDNYLLRIVGDGPRRGILENLVTQLRVNERVAFLGIRTNIPDLLCESDVNVLSTHWEGFGLVSVEGMASGRPFIASDVDGLREVVKNAGILFSHGDYKQLAQEIKELCERPVFYKKVAEKCQERAKQFDISKMAKQYNAIYQNL